MLPWRCAGFAGALAQRWPQKVLRQGIPALTSNAPPPACAPSGLTFACAPRSACLKGQQNQKHFFRSFPPLRSSRGRGPTKLGPAGSRVGTPASVVGIMDVPSTDPLRQPKHRGYPPPILGRGEDRGARWLWVLSPKGKYLVVRGRNPASYTVASATRQLFFPRFATQQGLHRLLGRTILV
jgi:hypothetical protein